VKTTRATPAALVRLYLEWEASYHDVPSLELQPGQDDPDWRLLSDAQLECLDCTNDLCIDAHDLLVRAWRAGRDSGLDAARGLLDGLVRS